MSNLEKNLFIAVGFLVVALILIGKMEDRSKKIERDAASYEATMR